MMVMMTMMTVYYEDDEPVGIRLFGARISDRSKFGMAQR